SGAATGADWGRCGDGTVRHGNRAGAVSFANPAGQSCQSQRRRDRANRRRNGTDRACQATAGQEPSGSCSSSTETPSPASSTDTRSRANTGQNPDAGQAVATHSTHAAPGGAAV